MSVATSCPCGSDAVIDGACSSCGAGATYGRVRADVVLRTVTRRSRRRRCGSHVWNAGDRVYMGGEYRLDQSCQRAGCSAERFIAVD